MEEKGRFIGRVVKVEYLDHPEYVYREGESRKDWSKFDKQIIIDHIRRYESDFSGNFIGVVKETKRLKQEAVKLFVGNIIAFDATISQDGVIKSMRNICGKQVRYYDELVNEMEPPRVLKQGVVPIPPSNCLYCKYRTKGCENNRLPM